MISDDLITIDDLLNADPNELNRLNVNQLKKVINHYAPIARERRKNEILKIREAKLPIPTVYKTTAKNTWYYYRFGYKSGLKDQGKLRAKLANIVQFLSDKTTTLEGWTEALNNLGETLNKYKKGTWEKIKDNFVTPNKYSQFWKIYNKAKENSTVKARLISKDYSSSELQRLISDLYEVDNKDFWSEDKFVKQIENVLTELKESERTSEVQRIEYDKNSRDNYFDYYEEDEDLWQ